MKNEIKKRVLYCGYGLLDSHVALAFPSVSQVKVGNKSSTGSPFLERIWPVLIIDLTYVTLYSVCNFHKQFTKTRNNQTCKYLKLFSSLRPLSPRRMVFRRENWLQIFNYSTQTNMICS